MLAVCLADVLQGYGQVARAGWLLIFGAGLLLAAVVMVLLAWRRFRCRFVGLQETLEELREDLIWLREAGGKTDAKPEATAGDARKPD